MVLNFWMNLVYLKKNTSGLRLERKENTSNMMAVQPTPLKKPPISGHFNKIQIPEIIWVTFVSWGVVFFLLGDGTWNRFSWHEETGRNFVSEMSAFPNADPCRHGSMAEVKWTAWSVIIFAVPFLPMIPMQKKWQLDYKRNLWNWSMPLKEKERETSEITTRVSVSRMVHSYT